MPPPIIYPFTAGKKVAWYEFGFTDIFDGSFFFDEAGEIVADAEWRRFIFEFVRPTPAGTSEDRAQFGFDCVNLTGGGWDNTWTTADHDVVGGHMQTFYTALKPLINQSHSNVVRKAYRRRFNPNMTADKRFLDSGPPTWQYAPPTPNGANNLDALPYQVAMSCTLKTAMPRHWGRFYLPGMTEDAITSNGRWDTADVATVSTALGVFLNAMWDAQFPVVVASTQIDQVLGGTIMTVQGGQVDDIPDVIRRRRPRSPAVRTLSPIT